MLLTIAKLILLFACLAVIVIVVHYVIELIRWLWERRKHEE